ncbi:MAG: hypothetical protein QOD76_216 [Solirubrobacteraceae bacterium]|nr:hypothetical protein [Solirubrobacteraceae bacterium]
MRRMTDARSGCLRATWCLKQVRTVVASGLVTFSLALPPVALGASASVAGYSRPGGAQQSDVASRNASNARSSGGVLPFSGLDLWWIGGGGALLAGVGVLLAALARGGGVEATRANDHASSASSRAARRETEAQYSLC